MSKAVAILGAVLILVVILAGGYWAYRWTINQGIKQAEMLATENQEQAESMLGNRIIPDTVYAMYDENGNAISLWVRGRVPEYGSVVDLRKTTLTITYSGTSTDAEYVVANSSTNFDGNACQIKNPWPINDPTNPGDVDYNALDGTKYTVVWLDCDGKNEDYLVYPGQVIMIVYKTAEPIPPGTRVKMTISATNGGRYMFVFTIPENNKALIRDIPV
ncbi:MAG: hypothetical protein PWQ11_609 [Candidatus Diapherotrites archaeon]|nr:hypothetical protein [Candidatus Diapherotrites archaeon]